MERMDIARAAGETGGVFLFQQGGIIHRLGGTDMNLQDKAQSTVVLIRAEGMGQGERELQLKLIGTYFKLLLENAWLPNAVCLYTDGVKLAVSGSPVLEQLKALEERGVRLILCSTCLNFYGLAEQVQVGIVGGMNDILEAQMRAGKVITL